VTGHESKVGIDPLFGDSDNDEQTVAIFWPGNNHNQTNEIRAINAQNLASRREEVEELRTEMQSSVTCIIERIGVTNTHIRWIALQPVQRPHFTAQDRGQVRHKYTRRKVVWDKIGEMIRGGH
jgi:hypothetical protein